MGAPKRIWQLIKAVAAIIGIIVAGLIVFFSIDMSKALSPSSFHVSRSSGFAELNSTHYYLEYNVNVTNTGFIYIFNYSFTVNVYVNASVDDCPGRTAEASFTNGSVLSPGESSQIVITVIIEKSLWNNSTSFIIGVKNTFTGVLFNQPITSIGMEVYDQLK
jgi:hypothetical protein